MKIFNKLHSILENFILKPSFLNISSNTKSNNYSYSEDTYRKEYGSRKYIRSQESSFNGLIKIIKNRGYSILKTSLLTSFAASLFLFFISLFFLSVWLSFITSFLFSILFFYFFTHYLNRNSHLLFLRYSLEGKNHNFFKSLNEHLDTVSEANAFYCIEEIIKNSDLKRYGKSENL